MGVGTGSGVPFLLVRAPPSLHPLQSQHGNVCLAALTEEDALMEEGYRFLLNVSNHMPGTVVRTGDKAEYKNSPGSALLELTHE